MLENKISNFNETFENYNEIIKQQFKNFNSLLENKELQKVIEDYQKNQEKIEEERKKGLGFNIFTSISATYYRENFHSYILTELLRADGKILKSFIDYLNKIKEDNCEEIPLSDFAEGSFVEREKRKIDICIENEKSKSIIIIENKMNWAGDQPRQIPRYYETCKVQGYEKIYIVYLPINQNKFKPDETGWTKEDKEKVYENFITLFAYKNKEKDLYTFFNQQVEKIENEDIRSSCRQYAKLIKNLGEENRMDENIMNKFYEQIKDKDINELNSFKNAINDLPKYFALKIIERYRNKESITAWIYKDTVGVLDFHSKSQIALDIVYSHQHISLDLFLRNVEEIYQTTLDIIPKIGDYLTWNDNNRFVKTMSYEKSIEETFKKLFSFLDDKLIPLIQESIKQNDQ